MEDLVADGERTDEVAGLAFDACLLGELPRRRLRRGLAHLRTAAARHPPLVGRSEQVLGPDEENLVALIEQYDPRSFTRFHGSPGVDGGQTKFFAG
ncbi:Uncharacterised protein [Mycobacteroides abscessus subsp. abscessus]|nr:Uncharacterised protein [Mycobacteroides abscessus subsp. abscessus]